MKRNPVLWAMSLLAFLQALTLSVAFTDVVPAKWAALASAVVLAGQLGIQFWVRGQVTPLSDPRGRDGSPLERAG